MSDTSRQFGGDNLGVAVEEQNGQRPGGRPRTPDGMTSGRQVKCAAGGGGDGDRIGGTASFILDPQEVASYDIGQSPQREVSKIGIIKL